MARGKKGIDGVDKVISLFPAGSHKMIERLLVRAAQRDAKVAGRNVKYALQGISRSSRATTRKAGNLAIELERAIRHRSDIGGNKTSIRQKSPQSGGRSFHFAHSVINKKEGAPSASGQSGTGKAGKAAAHMRYIEREIAVERSYGQGLHEPTQSQEHDEKRRDDDGPGPEVGSARENDGQSHASSASAGQEYIENPVKLANGEQVIFSFGTIGERFEDRVHFWQALDEAEAHPNARVQHRLIVELPHEASAKARFDMVKLFTRRFDADGIPYWAALHAPGNNNDSRNYHAHIVYSERPAMRMVDPNNTGAGPQWDFEIQNTYTKKSRNRVTTRPHRQKKLRAYHDKDFIPKLRNEFSDAVNTILERDDVKGKDGSPVLYDARSYKDMGVDAVPMKAINRIVADKVKHGKLTVLDDDYTKRMITAELREAAAKRQKGVMELIALEDVLRKAAESGRPQTFNKKLPKDLRVSPWAHPSKAALKIASSKILEARHAALHIDVMERATAASLERIISATSPKAVAAAANSKDPSVAGEAPSADAAAFLHAAALDELAATKESTAEARRLMGYKIGNAVNEWQTLVEAPPPEISTAVKTAIRQMDQEEEQADREAQSPAPRTGESQSQDADTVRVQAMLAAGEKESQPTGPVLHSAMYSKASTLDTKENASTSADAGSISTELPDASRPELKKAQPNAHETQTGQAAASPRRPAGVHPLTSPMTMEERLKVKMPPTVADLEAASKMVSGWLRAATEGEDDPKKKIENVKSLVAALVVANRERRKQAIDKYDGPKPAAEPQVVSEMPGPAAAVPDVTATTETPPMLEEPNGGLTPQGAVPREMPERPVNTQTPTAAPKPEAERKTSLNQAPPQAHLSTDKAHAAEGVPANSKVAGTTRGAKEETSGSVLAKPTTAGETSERQSHEDADDARRRKKREEEEKRKKKRKAVLGRNNRGRSR